MDSKLVFTVEEDDLFINRGDSSERYSEFGGVRIDFKEGPGVIEINMPVASNDDPHQLVVESEETIEYAEAQSENNYDEDADSVSDSNTVYENKFPIKIVESASDSVNRLTIADIMLRMSEQAIDTSVELSKDIIETGSNAIANECVEAPTKDGSMIVDGILSLEPSNISIDEEDLENSNAVQNNPHYALGENDFNDVYPFDTTSQFFNSSNGRQVLVLLKTKIFFHGAMSIRLIAGRASIYGYELKLNETVFSYSLCRDSFLYLSPTSQCHQIMNDFQVNLNTLSDLFISSDLECVASNFDCSADAIVLLENDFNNKSIYMIQNYMKGTVFPNIEKINNRRHPFHSSESILRCRLLTHTENGLRINPEWEDVVMRVNSRQMIIGGKGVGKSTFLRYLINKSVNEFEQILLIDLDVGQAEMFVPQTVSATVITDPILGPGYLRNTSPHKSYLFGDINILVSPVKYLKCVLKLLKYCSCQEEFRSMPWVINTMGYSHGFGLELIAAILRALNPTDLIQIQSTNSANNFGTILEAKVVNSFCFNIFKNEVQHMQSECTYSTYVYDTMSKDEGQDEWNKSQKDLRYAMILSKLGSMLQGNVNWITDVKPLL